MKKESIVIAEESEIDQSEISEKTRLMNFIETKTGIIEEPIIN